MTKGEVLSRLVAEGLVVIQPDGVECAGRTARVSERGGRIVIERHVAPLSMDSMIVSVKRQNRAADKLGLTDQQAEGVDAYALLTAEQRAEVDSTIVVYAFETV